MKPTGELPLSGASGSLSDRYVDEGETDRKRARTENGLANLVGHTFYQSGYRI
ncbi:hypothetical protein Hmuk_0275 [Halomicrobium mukohataei DSM 12286]|uniref:Uncharacterized protein n=1 Tax=Halomicrobium mukohataei (strain ATCC 700874 / DSM 12286 / JCM 9738 / NCIMB 13541) TaxID=485914 RepID=C7NX47_HALMD|nr:hypothetical protein Hmuk_0275 [Halomicrobium mukohataei DSM 12286]